MTNECANPHQLNNNDVRSCNFDCSTIDGCSDTEQFEKETSSATSAYEVIQGSARATSLVNELVLYEQTRQLSCVLPSSSSMSLTTFDRSVEELKRANDLKNEENGLTRRKLMLKEMDLSLKYESNNLGKSKLEMGGLKAAFRAEKFKTELEDTRKAEMVTRIMDWLVVSVCSMLASMLLGVYNFSQKRIEDATSVCEPSEEKSSSWWVPKQVSLMNSGFNIFICRVRVWVQFFFGVLMIIVFTYFISKRSAGTKQTMPISFIVLFLGIFCGISGKLCVDTLGGNGKLWLIVWEVFCLFQFVANVFTLALYSLMFGRINGTQSSRCNSMFPYWARRSVLYVVILFVLPAINGLLPFATFGEWRDLAMYQFLGGLDS